MNILQKKRYLNKLRRERSKDYIKELYILLAEVKK